MRKMLSIGGILKLAAFIAGIQFAILSRAQAPMVYIYNAPEAGEDQRYRYHLEVLRSALEVTRPSFGPYVLKPSVPMTEERQAAELSSNTGAISIVIRGANMEYFRRLRPVAIPIDKGILGYRVLLIRAQDQARFSQVKTLKDLREVVIGQGTGWKDVDILRDNGLQVVTGTSYPGLFQMLAAKRFDAFSRGIEEVSDEYLAYKNKVPSLAIESSLLLYYPFPRYFWFGTDANGQALAERVREGMQIVIRNGTLDSLFDQFFKERFDALGLRKRQLIKLENPSLPGDALHTDEPSLANRPK